MNISVMSDDGNVRSHEGSIELADAHLLILAEDPKVINAIYAPGRWLWAKGTPENAA